ncbi:MAG: methyltransferase, partial [Rickettsiales bacterium]|nr:methyltransferase [Rickettsiales bacterium]
KTESETLLHETGIARASWRTGEGGCTVIATLHPITMRFGATDVKLPPAAFLQAAAEGQHALTEAVLRGIPSEGAVVDLFCGLGTYSLPLSARQPVQAVEMDETMISTLRKAAPPNLTAEMRDLFTRPLIASELSRFTAAVINPPRAGAKAQTQAIAAAGIPHVVMVSCNPATFARDAGLLRQSGYRLAAVLGLDQFVFSPHLEIVASFVKQ